MENLDNGEEISCCYVCSYRICYSTSFDHNGFVLDRARGRAISIIGVLFSVEATSNSPALGHDSISRKSAYAISAIIPLPSLKASASKPSLLKIFPNTILSLIKGSEQQFVTKNSY